LSRFLCKNERTKNEAIKIKAETHLGLSFFPLRYDN